MSKRYTEPLQIRFTKDEYAFITMLAEDRGKSKSEVVRELLWFFRIMCEEDLPFWKVVASALPSLIERREEILKDFAKEATSKARLYAGY